MVLHIPKLEFYFVYVSQPNRRSSGIKYNHIPGILGDFPMIPSFFYSIKVRETVQDE